MLRAGLRLGLQLAGEEPTVREPESGPEGLSQTIVFQPRFNSSNASPLSNPHLT